MAKRVKTVIAPQVLAVEPIPETNVVVIKPAKSAPLSPIEESRESLNQVLPPGQKFFESPEGYVIIGDSDRNSVFCRQANNGKGCHINPKR